MSKSQLVMLPGFVDIAAFPFKRFLPSYFSINTSLLLFRAVPVSTRSPKQAKLVGKRSFTPVPGTIYPQPHIDLSHHWGFTLYLHTLRYSQGHAEFIRAPSCRWW
jgi:hypothetical protein